MQANVNLFQFMLIQLKIQPKCISVPISIIVIAAWINFNAHYKTIHSDAILWLGNDAIAIYAFCGFYFKLKSFKKKCFFCFLENVTAQIIIKERARVWVPVNFDKLLFPCSTNSNYVSTITSTTKVSVQLKVFARKL